MHTATRSTRLARKSNSAAALCARPSCRELNNEIRVALSGAAEVHRALCAAEQVRIGNYEFASRILPARHVGGDFVCMVKRGPNSIAIIGDLMGKGLPAAMWLTHSIDLIHRAAERTGDLSSMMAEWNRELVQSRVGAPLTTAVAVEISQNSNRLSYIAAGHPPALLLRQSGIEPLTGDAPILGAFSNAHFDAKEILLDPDDVLLAYSDGVSEARNDDEKEFSVDGLTASLRGTTGMPLASRVSRLLSDVMEYCNGRPFDDVSVLAIKHQ